MLIYTVINCAESDENLRVTDTKCWRAGSRVVNAAVECWEADYSAVAEILNIKSRAEHKNIYDES